MPRILLWIIAIPLALIVLAAVLVPLFLSEEKLIAMAASTLEKQTGAQLSVEGGASLSLFPNIAISLGHTSLLMPEEEGSSVSVRSLDIGVELIPLLSQRVEIDEVTVDGLVAVLPFTPEQPQADTAQMSDAELDAFYAARRKALDEAQAGAGAEAALAATLALNVKQLSITDSRIDQLDAAGDASTTAEIVELKATGLNLDARPIPLRATIRLPGSADAAPIEIGLEGELGVDQHSQAAVMQGLTVKVNGATAAPLKMVLDGKAEMPNQVADLQVVIELGETRGEGRVHYGSFESPQIDADLHLNLFDPALLALAGPEAAEKVAEADTGSDASGDEPLPLDALRSIDTRAKLSIDKARFDVHEITAVKARVRAVEGSIKLLSLTGDLHGGKIDMKANFNAKHNTAKLSTQGGLNGMNIATALAAMESDPLMSGGAGVNWKLQSAGTTANELIEALKGPINIDTQDAVLQGTSVEHMLCKAVALANQQALSANFPESSSFEQLSMKLDLKDGKLRLTPLTARLPGVSLKGQGRVMLLEQNFSAKFAARLSPELGEVDPACEINERYTSLDWPVICEGDLGGDPGDWCTVDTEDILTELLSNEAERKIKKEAGKFFDKLLER